MTRRVLRVLVEVEGAAFDPEIDNPYADSQAELETVLSSNLQTITSMDAGDVITLRDTNGNRCGKVEMEDFPGDSPLLPHWARLSDLALEVEEEFPVSRFLKESERSSRPLEVAEVDGTETRPKREPLYSEADSEAARKFDEGQIAYPGPPSSHEHVAERHIDDPVIPTRPRRSNSGNSDVPAPPGDPRMK